jgi:hypothetical protein
MPAPADASARVDEAIRQALKAAGDLYGVADAEFRNPAEQQEVQRFDTLEGWPSGLRHRS